MILIYDRYGQIMDFRNRNLLSRTLRMPLMGLNTINLESRLLFKFFREAGYQKVKREWTLFTLR